MTSDEERPPSAARWAGAVVLAALAACGGGSGSGGGGDEEPPSGPSARLDAQSAPDAAAVAIELLVLAALPDLYAFVDAPAGDGAPQGCTDGGTLSHGFELDLAPLGQVSAGDRYYVELAACAAGDATLDGRLELDLVLVEGALDSGGDYELQADLTVESLVESLPGGEATQDAQLAVSAGRVEEFTTHELAGAADVVRTGAGAPATWTLHDLAVTSVVEDLGGGLVQRSQRFDAIFETSAIDGVLTVETVAPLVAFDDDWPFLGELLIRGGGGATLRVVALDSQLVDLLIDEDGDGAVDASAQLFWSEL